MLNITTRIEQWRTDNYTLINVVSVVYNYSLDKKMSEITKRQSDSACFGTHAPSSVDIKEMIRTEVVSCPIIDRPCAYAIRYKKR